MNRARLTHSTALISLSVLAAASLAACGSSSSSSKSAGGTSAGATAGASGGSTSTLSAASIKTFTDYTGGKAGKATGTPITVGYANNQGGANAFPEFTVATEAAVNLVNNSLGGVNGHPITLNTCFIANSDEEGQTCAQKFLADTSVVGVMQLNVSTGVQSFHSTIGGKLPVLGINPTDISDATAANSYYIEGGQFSAQSLVTYLTKTLKAKKVALMSAAGIPVAVQAASALKGALTAAGIQITQSTYSPTATDFVAPIAASGASSADAFVPLVVTPPQCISLGKAVKQIALKTKVVSLAACLGAPIKAALGDYPSWDYLDFTINPLAKDANPTTQAQVDAYKEWVAPIQSQVPDLGAAVQALQEVLTFAKLMGQAGSTPTPAALGKAMKAFTGPVLLGAPSVSFGTNPVLPEIGSEAARFYHYDSSAGWTDLTNGTWLSPPAFTGPPPGSGGGGGFGAPGGAPGGAAPTSSPTGG